LSVSAKSSAEKDKMNEFSFSVKERVCVHSSELSFDKLGWYIPDLS